MNKSSKKTKNFTFFDTDMFIHRLSTDLPVRQSAEKLFSQKNPSAMSEFSIVEFKGNYIAALILLRRKVCDSDTLIEAFSRVQNSGGRRAALMLAQLFLWIGHAELKLTPWEETKNILLTYLDAQIAIVWESFFNCVDEISRQFNCTRATEMPEDNDGKWSASIPKCRSDNTNCQIREFFEKFQEELALLVDNLRNLPAEEKTDELNKIQNISKQLIDKRLLSHQMFTCRSIGDLLIGLDSKSGSGLLSSNYKEHSVLSRSLGYTFLEFQFSRIRSK